MIVDRVRREARASRGCERIRGHCANSHVGDADLVPSECRRHSGKIHALGCLRCVVATVESILSWATAVANDWCSLAMWWHIALAALVFALVSGYYPTRRLLGLVLALPVISVRVNRAMQELRMPWLRGPEDTTTSEAERQTRLTCSAV